MCEALFLVLGCSRTDRTLRLHGEADTHDREAAGEVTRAGENSRRGPEGRSVGGREYRAWGATMGVPRVLQSNRKAWSGFSRDTMWLPCPQYGASGSVCPGPGRPMRGTRGSLGGRGGHLS